MSRFEQIIGFEKDLNSNSKWINKAFRWKDITAFRIKHNFKKICNLENQTKLPDLDLLTNVPIL